ncbi:MAG: carboxymuconolactone decarboxylase family protein [Trueperaceae bacterium]
MRGALRVGASERQIRETIIHAAMFVGFPKALAAMRALERFLGDR